MRQVSALQRLSASWIEQKDETPVESGKVQGTVTGKANEWVFLQHLDMVETDTGVKITGNIFSTHATQFDIAHATCVIKAELFNAAGASLGFTNTVTYDLHEMRAQDFELEFNIANPADISKVVVTVATTEVRR
jgi:hypothetical protein